MKTNACSLSLIAVCAAALLALPAQAEDAKPADKPTKADDNACTWFHSIDDWRALDNRNLVVWASRKEFYHVQLGMPLTDLRFADSIGFVDHNNDGRICGFGMDEIVIPHSSVFGHSNIISMTRLDDAGLAALGEKYHVKFGGKKKTPAPQKPTESADKEADKSN